MCKTGWFAHDASARRDPKIRRLRADHGWRGYGLFMALLEMLREERDYALDLDWRILSAELAAPRALIRSVVMDYDLFEIATIDGREQFYSRRMIKQMRDMTESRHATDRPKTTISDKRRAAARSRWTNANAMQNPTLHDANAMQNPTLHDANAMQNPTLHDANEGTIGENKKKTKTKKKKLEERGSALSRGTAPQDGAEQQDVPTLTETPQVPTEAAPRQERFRPPTLHEVKDYIASSGYSDVNPEAFIAHYESNGWRVGRNPMKNWHAAVRTWACRQREGVNVSYVRAASLKTATADKHLPHTSDLRDVPDEIARYAEQFVD